MAAKTSPVLLEGLKVVELATWIAGPGCAALMADWGAEVIKVESPTGDPTRTVVPNLPCGSENPVFALENRGKRSLVLDLARRDDLQVLRRLLQESDVFITNLRPSALARLGLEPARLRRDYPALICANISGYGSTGPDADRPAFDLTAFWSRSGVAWATIPPDQEPFPCRPGFGDHMTALATLSAILAALHERAVTGHGRLVETSLIRTAAYAVGWDLSILLGQGEVVAAQPRDDRPSPISGYFRTADDRWLCVVPRAERCFAALLRALGLTDVLADRGFAPPIVDLARVRHLRSILDRTFGALTLDAAGARLTAEDLVWAPMATLTEFVSDPQARLAGCFVTAETSEGSLFSAPAAPAAFPEGEPIIRRRAPRLGEHNADVLGKLTPT
jgi:crotonobetainyl-CoA:carnitine CoA-transferase CaiB-like acyl-CoA transferase